MNITDYVLKNTNTIAETGFNSVDALALAQFSYAKLEHMLLVEGDAIMKTARIKDFLKSEYFDAMFSDGITDTNNRDFMYEICASRRFRDIRIVDISSEQNFCEDKQFAAMIFELDNKTDVVAFRGTDGSLVGWKEDLILSFRDEIPSHSAAVAYIDQFYGRKGPRRGRRLYITGHSKGGNLAIYASAMAEPSIRKNIVKVFSLDGPGFSRNTSDQISEALKETPLDIERIIPKGSVIGVLLNAFGNCTVVSSDEWGIMQHMAYSWEIDEETLYYVVVEAQNWGSEFVDRTIENWLEFATDEQRELVVETIFALLEDNQLQTVSDLKALSAGDAIDLISQLRHMDEETRIVAREIIRNLARSAVNNITKN